MFSRSIYDAKRRPKELTEKVQKKTDLNEEVRELTKLFGAAKAGAEEGDPTDLTIRSMILDRRVCAVVVAHPLAMVVLICGIKSSRAVMVVQFVVVVI
ncbi:hypothetical protein QVD17_38083 [Tagetes erecta]|uniref:Uncharacterized protein n=1 Tax=Tagetes erecta TaxID=13708 RepID=A0AAD8JXA1_TARER|nr:hypothetical protein QVD17_38083 [Tagetes erecta]